MLKRTIYLFALAALAGCAGTKQAAVEPAPVPAPAAETVAVSQPAPAQGATQSSMLEVADMTPVPQDGFRVVPAAQPALPDPYQCMLAWAQGVQDALKPWTHTAQACDIRAVKP